MKENMMKEIDIKYPPNVFMIEDSYGIGHMERGVQEQTCIRRLNQEDMKNLEFLSSLVGEKLL